MTLQPGYQQTVTMEFQAITVRTLRAILKQLPQNALVRLPGEGQMPGNDAPDGLHIGLVEVVPDTPTPGMFLAVPSLYPGDERDIVTLTPRS